MAGGGFASDRSRSGRREWRGASVQDVAGVIGAYKKNARGRVLGFFCGEVFDGPRHSTILFLPIPFMVAVLATLPLTAVITHLRRRRRARRSAAGRCLS